MRKFRFLLILFVALFAMLVVSLEASKKRAESISCASSVTSICLAARLWAEDNGGFMPTNFICMSNELATTRILTCQPSQRAAASDWSQFTSENSTYEIIAPRMRMDDTNTAFLRCKIHGHLGYSDATVFDGNRRRTKFE